MRKGWLILQLLYWRRYAKSLERQLEGERWRNQNREDQLLTVPMRYLGMYGVAEREGPARPMDTLRRRAQRRPAVPTNDAWSTLTDDERLEWQSWSADVDPTPDQVVAAKREFLEMIRQRKFEQQEMM